MSETTQEELLEAPTQTAEASVPEIILIEGYGYVNAETGALIESDDEVPSEFAISIANASMASTQNNVPKITTEAVEWSLRKLFKLDGEILAAETRLKAETEAINKNWKPRINRLKGAKSSFLAWVTPQLREYATESLNARNTKPDGSQRANPEKSVKFPQGTLAFRSVNETVIAKPTGGAAESKVALAWIKEHYPYAVKVVLDIDLDALSDEDRAVIEAVTSGSMTMEEAGWTEPCPLKVTLPGEKFDVRTGVK